MLTTITFEEATVGNASCERQWVGVDLHLHRSVISRIDDRGELVEWGRIDNDPKALVKEVRKASRRAQVALEATYGWYWAVDALQAAKFEVHLAHPYGMKKMRKTSASRPTRRTRTSSPTCCAWGPCLRRGSRRSSSANCGQLVRHRHRLVKASTSVKSGIRGLLAKPAPTDRYDLPIYATVKVHRDHHLEVGKALYSVPGNLIGTHVQVRADSQLVRIFSRGQLVKVHPARRSGSAAPTRPTFLRSGPSMRWATSTSSSGSRAGHGTAIGLYAAALLEHPLPWTKMRQVYALLGLVKKWGGSKVDAACASALEHEAINVALIGRMLERGSTGASDATPIQPRLPGTGTVVAGRFARDPEEFATRRASGGAQ